MRLREEERRRLRRDLRAGLGPGLAALALTLEGASNVVGHSPVQAQALRELARYLEHCGLRLDVDAPASLPALPAAVEVAAYRIAQEAVTTSKATDTVGLATADHETWAIPPVRQRLQRLASRSMTSGPRVASMAAKRCSSAAMSTGQR